jgi:uncharacterized protein (UPF0276 family)
MVMHGVSLSIGSADPLDLGYLGELRALADRIEPAWVSDHLCWTGVDHRNLHDLLPLALNRATLEHLLPRIAQVQELLGRRLVLENVSSYLQFEADELGEAQFIAELARRSGCGLLLDVNNVYVSSRNHRFDPQAYIDTLPPESVVQIHLAGHEDLGDLVIDTHDHPVCDAVWALYAYTLGRIGPRPSMIERDDHIPPLPELLAELDQAREVAARTETQPEPRSAERLTWPTPSAPPLGQLQEHFAALVLAEAPPQASPPGAAIYHHAYRARLQEVLADHYPKVQRYVGAELFNELARGHAQQHPPLERNLAGYGAQLPGLIAERYPGNAELHDLAALEWAMRSVFDAADQPAWTPEAVAEAGAETCLTQTPVRHPTLRLLTLRSNAHAIWSALHADTEVPLPEPREPPQRVAVWRRGHQPHFMTLDRDEAGFLGELNAPGRSIAQVCEDWLAQQRFSSPTQLAGWLQGWWEQELLLRA